MKILVAYFSAYGTTAKLAKMLAESIGADLHEIVPTDEYSLKDLDWTDTHSRSSVEMLNKTLRPAISSYVRNMEEYDIIFLGFPIWHYTAPTIINTFLEQYDFTGKTIVPFATSRLSGIEIAHGTISNLASGANVMPGMRFEKFATQDELAYWAERFIDHQ